MSRVGKVGQLDGMFFVEKKEEVPSSGTNSLTSTIKSTISLQSFLLLLFPTQCLTAHNSCQNMLSIFIPHLHFFLPFQSKKFSNHFFRQETRITMLLMLYHPF